MLGETVMKKCFPKNELSKRSYNITIITWDNDLEKFFPDSFYKINSKVEIVNLNIGKSNWFELNV